MHPQRDFVAAGGLLSYGANLVANWRRAAVYVHRILGGERAGDLPVEQPTLLELVINATAAKRFGITLPPSLLARADEIIE
jgi:putative ABC transport system substrate-binding protein